MAAPQKAKAVRAGSLYKQKGSSFWWAKYYMPGNPNPIRESTKKTDWDEAQKYLWNRLGDTAKGKFVGLEPERVTAGELFDMIEEDYVINNRASKPALMSRLTHLRPYFGHLKASSAGTRQVDSYKAFRKHEKAKNATINRELEVLRRAFNLAYNAEPPLIMRPLHVVKLKEDNIREGILSHLEYQKLREVLPEPYKTLFVCGYHLGTRLGELLKLEWSEVDFDRAVIELKRYNTKTKKPRVLPIYGDMKPFLLLAKETTGEKYPWVFVKNGRQFQFVPRVWKTKVKNAGLPTLRFHDLRRTALTNMIEAGIPEKEAMEISGHTTRKTFERYHIVRHDRLAQVGEKMEKYLNPPKPPEEEKPISAAATIQ